MSNLSVVGLLIFIIAVSMTMVGKGGGNFYVVVLAMSGIGMHEAATTGQFILFTASVAAMFVFHKHRSLSWTLAVLMGAFTSLSAFAGGYFSCFFGAIVLKLIFAVMLFIAGMIMLFDVAEKVNDNIRGKFGSFTVKSGNTIYYMDLRIVLPVTVLTGFASGMVGVSGGSFLVPLMVLACGVPMLTAVGTASVLIAITSFMGFAGHALRGDFNPYYAIPLAFVTVLGGVTGGKFSLRSKPRNLKRLFAYTNWIAAFIMVLNILRSRGII